MIIIKLNLMDGIDNFDLIDLIDLIDFIMEKLTNYFIVNRKPK